MDEEIKEELKDELLEGTFYYPPDDVIFQEHFPGHPVVPGSMIVNAFLIAGEKLGFTGDNLKIENFRFKEFLVPGRQYPFRIEVKNGRLYCFIVHGDKLLVTGILEKI